MPTGVNNAVERNLPTEKYTIAPDVFNGMTQRNHHRPLVFADPGDNNVSPIQTLPPAGIIGWLTLTFDANMTVALGGGTATTGWMWPYGLVSVFDLSANFQNSLIHLTGTDLHVMRFLSNPSYVDGQDVFPGTVGGGNALSSATSQIHLTWQIPVVMDKVSLVGALYAQSQANQLGVTVQRLKLTDATAGNALITTTGAATASFANATFQVALDSWDIPRHPEMGIVIPDLSRLHGLNIFDQGITTTGDTNVNLIKVNGQLTRLLVQARNGNNTPLDPKASAASGFNTLSLAYGGNKLPQVWDMASLVARNNEQYGAPLPYKYVALDMVRENPQRDAVFLQGVTDLRAIVNLASSVVLGANSNVHVVEETLFK